MATNIPKITETHVREVLAFTLFRTDKTVKSPSPQPVGDTWRKSPDLRENYRTQAAVILRQLEEAGIKLASFKPFLTNRVIKDMVTQPAVAVYSVDDLDLKSISPGVAPEAK